VTVAFAGLEQQQATRVAELAPVQDRYGGTAGLLVEEAGPLACWPGVDALIVSTDNAMTRWPAGGTRWPHLRRRGSGDPAGQYGGEGWPLPRRPSLFLRRPRADTGGHDGCA
jgi:hypothetical protein